MMKRGHAVALPMTNKTGEGFNLRMTQGRKGPGPPVTSTVRTNARRQAARDILRKKGAR